MSNLIYPKDGDTVKIQTDTQRNFGSRKKNAQTQKAFDWLDLKRSETEDCTKPLPVTFRFDGKGTSRFELADNKDFSDATVIQTTKSELTIENLFVNKTYYWRVNGGETACFRTEDVVPRWINIDGLSNVRDNGNRKTADGKRTKQGLLFRGTEMDIHHNITDKGKWQITEGIKIKTDLDLRGETIGCPLGDKFKFINILARAYDCFVEDKEICKQLFDVFADETNYPIYLHCWGGADRTGTIFFILNAMLGVDYEENVLDYEATSLSIWGERNRNSELFVNFLNALDKYGDETVNINEKVKRFLLDCGVSESQMDKIRNILTEDERG